jgi:hypothetical protein
MNSAAHSDWIAFEGHSRLAQGDPATVVQAVHALVMGHPQAQPLVFEALAATRIELDWRAPLAQLLDGLPASVHTLEQEIEGVMPGSPRGPGRPRLGVTAREVTLLPRHWDWLATQSGGASVALRRLVQNAMRENRAADLARQRSEAAYRFMSVMASGLPGFEEASRALFAGDLARLQGLVADWPTDLRGHQMLLAQRALAPAGDA